MGDFEGRRTSTETFNIVNGVTHECQQTLEFATKYSGAARELHRMSERNEIVGAVLMENEFIDFPLEFFISSWLGR